MEQCGQRMQSGDPHDCVAEPGVDLRNRFAGLVGLFAVHPDERLGGLPGFAGYSLIVSSDSLYVDLLINPESTFDDRYYLRARLIDPSQVRRG